MKTKKKVPLSKVLLTALIETLIVICALSAVSALAGDLESVVSGMGKTKFDATFQAWGYSDSTAANPKQNFRLRRSEIKLAGNVTDDTRWFFMMDPAKTINTLPGTDNKVIQDLGVVFSPAAHFEVVMGQFKIPTTYEGYETSMELLLPERTVVSRGTSADHAFGDRREPGFMTTYKDDSWRVLAAITNGQRTNVDDVNSAKDLHIRVDHDLSKELRVGGFTTAGDFRYGTKGRWGLNALYKPGSFIFRAEGIHVNDSGIRANGWDALTGYSLNDHFQPVVQYETYNVDFKAKTTSIGLNYYRLGHYSKIQSAVMFLNGMNGSNGVYVPLRGKNGTLFIVAFQAAL